MFFLQYFYIRFRICTIVTKVFKRMCVSQSECFILSDSLFCIVRRSRTNKTRCALQMWSSDIDALWFHWPFAHQISRIIAFSYVYVPYSNRTNLHATNMSGPDKLSFSRLNKKCATLKRQHWWEEVREEKKWRKKNSTKIRINICLWIYSKVGRSLFPIYHKMWLLWLVLFELRYAVLHFSFIFIIWRCELLLNVCSNRSIWPIRTMVMILVIRATRYEPNECASVWKMRKII